MLNRAQVLSLTFTATFVVAGCDSETIDHVPEESATDTGEPTPDETFASEVAMAYCAALFACGGPSACTESDDFTYDNEGDCVVEEQSRLEELRTNALAGGLTYDLGCVDQVIAAYTTAECHSLGESIMLVPSVVSAQGLECQPFVGTVPENDGTCIEVAGTNLSDCSAGLKCLDESCGTGWELNSCASCGAGTTCAEQPFVGSEQCLPILAEGLPCFDGETLSTIGYCDTQSYCDIEYDAEGIPVDGACAGRLAAGQACTAGSECLTFACEDGMCVTEPPVLCRYAPRYWRSN